MAWHIHLWSYVVQQEFSTKLNIQKIQKKYGIATKERSTVEKRPRKTKRLQESKKENRISLLLCLLLFSVFPMFLLLLGHCSLGGWCFRFQGVLQFYSMFTFVEKEKHWENKKTKTKRCLKKKNMCLFLPSCCIDLPISSWNLPSAS